jgi:hypothetical protein
MSYNIRSGYRLLSRAKSSYEATAVVDTALKGLR